MGVGIERVGVKLMEPERDKGEGMTEGNQAGGSLAKGRSSLQGQGERVFRKGSTAFTAT